MSGERDESISSRNAMLPELSYSALQWLVQPAALAVEDGGSWKARAGGQPSGLSPPSYQARRDITALFGLLSTTLGTRPSSSSALLSKPEPSTERIEKNEDRVNLATNPWIVFLMDNLTKLLKAERPGDALRFLNNEIRRSVSNPNQFYAYESAITLFLRNGYALAASMVYRRMSTAGFLPSASIRTQLALTALAQRSPGEREILKALHEQFKQKGFDESALCDVLRLFAEGLGAEPVLVDKMVDAFLAAHGPKYVLAYQTVLDLVRIHTNARSPLTAQRWIEYHKGHTPQPPVLALASSPNPYTSILRDITGLSPADTSTYQWLLEQLDSNGVIPDIAFYNALIASEVARGRFPQVAAIYRLLLEHRTRTHTPDAYTFATLLRANRLGAPTRRLRLRDPDRRLTGIPSLRTLIGDMIACHSLCTGGRLSTPSPVLTPSVLAYALGTLMRTHDYAAALVLVRTMHIAALPPPLSTYRIIIAELARRVQRALPALSASDDPAAFWAYRFLGMAGYPVGQRVEVDAPLWIEILSIGTEPRLSLDYVPPPQQLSAKEAQSDSPSPGMPAVQSGDPEQKMDLHEFQGHIRVSEQHDMPSVLQLAEVVDTPADKTFAVTPLERILRRAILASRPTLVLAPAKEVSIEIAEAKKALLTRERTRAKKPSPK
ncbi:hypothetical protein POSPLADRAFT_1183281 [Postia placenta MAD-698-R-SB12]|uniref:Pentacotripeptide-repeat region of PRORP domain-containing protein n=1 Tax=Postia placenta MAD-698-R-SB12 TaxID=670580 RepID=A0A1X6MWM0_9APHY|nr:hypothetical protein POSPLADRAFT_1183281 [Postia placenta MAD-698-R-SB12]OSX60751.1 hypothetical protein POSPLADRAFT_1183281 [Postia placenta MAD-698-R-SB12]